MTQNTTNTNADNILLAANLAGARKGTFAGIVYSKKGVTRGGKANPTVYGNDIVHTVIYTGLIYENAVQKSLDALPDPDGDATVFAAYADSILAHCGRKGYTGKSGTPITHADIETAVRALRLSFTETLEGTNTSTTDHVYEPLLVNGEVVRGARVYRCVARSGRASNPCHCRDCTGDRRAPVDGQINILGLKIGERVLEAAPNGPIPRSNSRGDVVAKRVIRARLAIGRIRSYTFGPDDDYILNVGGAAALAATKAGVTVDPNEVAQAADLLAS